MLSSTCVTCCKSPANPLAAGGASQLLMTSPNLAWLPGFIISSSGTIVTNTHIVADAVAVGGAAGNAIVCTLQDGRSFQAELVNFDW